jgi:quercetin dioxygenase-like cupin family protein
MPVIRSAENRRTETPNGVMTTLASPAQGGAGLALWQARMGPGQQGPLHAFDAEQVWTFTEGGATVDLDGEKVRVERGDTVIMPPGAARQVFADPRAGFTAIVAAPGGARVYIPGGGDDACEMGPMGAERIVPPWAV